ncbi:MAG: universal stress protein [Pseudomonadales bacterium]|jgi:universal stress protein A
MFDKVLVAVDLELEPARALLKRAKELARGEIWVAHIVEPQYIQYSIDPTFTGSLTRAMEEDAINATRNRLAEICEPFGIDENHQLVRLGRAADGIHELAEEKAVDSIIITSHARHGLGRLLGSTANAVLHGAPVNVMTVRLTEEET